MAKPFTITQFVMARIIEIQRKQYKKREKKT